MASSSSSAARLNRFMVQPCGGINFDEVRFNEEPKKRKLDIRNEREGKDHEDGMFALSKDGEGKLRPPDVSALTLNQFSDLDHMDVDDTDPRCDEKRPEINPVEDGVFPHGSDDANVPGGEGIEKAYLFCPWSLFCIGLCLYFVYVLSWRHSIKCFKKTTMI